MCSGLGESATWPRVRDWPIELMPGCSVVANFKGKSSRPQASQAGTGLCVSFGKIQRLHCLGHSFRAFPRHGAMFGTIMGSKRNPETTQTAFQKCLDSRLFSKQLQESICKHYICINSVHGFRRDCVWKKSLIHCSPNNSDSWIPIPGVSSQTQCMSMKQNLSNGFSFRDLGQVSSWVALPFGFRNGSKRRARLETRGAWRSWWRATALSAPVPRWAPGGRACSCSVIWFRQTAEGRNGRKGGRQPKES